MTYKESKRIDLMLSEFLKENRIEISSSINEVNFVKKGSVPKLTQSELKKLLHLVRKEQTVIGIELINGHNILKVNVQTISDFLTDGGFEKIKRKRVIKWWTNAIKFALALATFGILIYVHFIKDQESDSKTIQETVQNESLMEKEEKPKSEELEPKISNDIDSLIRNQQSNLENPKNEK